MQTTVGSPHNRSFDNQDIVVNLEEVYAIVIKVLIFRNF